MKAENQNATIEQKWQKIAEKARDEARSMPPSDKRDNLLKKADQLEVAMSLNSWLSSPDAKSADVKSAG